tara:strand:- start:2101 stop:3144 length:1044 start_codon:yes stop_codon:yes gene_type:complete
MIEQQTLIEDGESIFINYEDYFFDPEQQPLTVLIDGISQGMGAKVSWNVSSDLQRVQFTPLPNANGAEVLQMSISDGVNPPLIADVPLRIEAVNDEFVVDETAWSITMEEEETVLLNLSEFATDIDGDALTWTVETSGNSKAMLALSGQELLVSALLDEWGLDSGWWLNVTDGTETYSRIVNITIEPLPDRPTLSNTSVEKTGDSELTIRWDWSDKDGDEMDVILQFDGVDVSGQRNCDANGTCFERVEIEIVPGLYVSIDIVARDDSFSDAVSRLQYVVPEEQSTPSLSDDIESNSGGTMVAVAITLPLLCIIGWLLYQIRKPPKNPVEEASAGGLLARAETMNQS